MSHPDSTARQGAGQLAALTDAARRRLAPARGTLITFAIYFVLRWLLLGRMQPVWFSDTAGYIAQYRQGFGGGLLGQARPWGYPLFLWLTGYHPGLAIALQRALAAGAWFALAHAAAGLFRRTWLRRTVCYSILGLSMALFIIQWDAMLLSESLSVTGFVALTAGWCRLAREERAGAGLPWLGLIAALALPFAGLRDASAPLLMLLALLIGVRVGLQYFFSQPRPARPPRGKTAAALALAGLLVATAALQHHDAQAGRRGWANIGNVLSMRAFVKEVFQNYYTVDAEHLDWMERRFQIPAKEAATRIGRNVSQAPPLSPAYRVWLETTGPRAWLSFLLHHPGWLLRSFGGHQTYDVSRTNYTTQEPAKWARSHLEPAVLIQAAVQYLAGWLLGLAGFNVLLMLAATTLGVLWAGSFRRAALRGYAAPLGALLWLSAAGVLAALVAFVGDSIETWRHALPGLVAIYIALPLGAGLLAEAGLDWLSRRNAPRAKEKAAPAAQGRAPARRKHANAKL